MTDLITDNITEIHSSVNASSWSLRDFNEKIYNEIFYTHNYPEIICRILAQRNVTSDKVLDFLNPKLRNELSDPYNLLDMEKAVKKIVSALEKNQKILVFGDYDVDGATSSALLKKYFNAINYDIEVYIPDRVQEGYGPSIDAFKKIKKEKIDIVITVDCGTMSFDALNYAAENKLDVIVLDHHLSDVILPKAYAIVNPNRLDEAVNNQLKHVAAVGIVFLFLVALNSELKARNFNNGNLPDLLKFLDIVALGTVCDVVSLHGINRAFVSQGLKLFAKRTNHGLAALADICKLNGTPNTYHLGYLIGPRINAGGRVGTSNLGSKVIASDDYEEAYKLALMLDSFNSERREIERQVLDEAFILAEKSTSSIIILASKAWHQGVVGIVAGRIKDKYNRPVAIISVNENNIGKASCRSIAGFDFGSAILSAKIDNLVLNGGGHAMAAGFSVDMQKIDQLIEFFENKYAKFIWPLTEQRERKYDAILSLNAINNELVDLLDKIGPFGQGNPEPRFLIKNVFIAKYQVFLGAHISSLLGTYGVGRSGNLVKANFFKSVGTPIEEAVLYGQKKPIDIIGYLKCNNWMGNKTPEFIVEDVIINYKKLPY